jgi:CHAT domain
MLGRPKRALRAAADWSGNQREAERTLSIELQLPRLPPEKWYELLGESIGWGFYAIVAGVPLLLFAHGRWAGAGFGLSLYGVGQIAGGVTGYGLFRGGQPVRGWRQAAVALAMSVIPVACLLLSAPLRRSAGIGIPAWEIYATVALLPVVAFGTVRYVTVRIAVARLPAPADDDARSLAWIDARLEYLESALRRRSRWPVPERDIVRAIGHCRLRRFEHPAGRLVADLLTAIKCFNAVAAQTARGARDEPGVYHDLASALIERARLQLRGEDYRGARAWVERIFSFGIAARLPAWERDYLQRWLCQRTLFDAAVRRRFQPPAAPAAPAVDVDAAVTEALRGLTEQGRSAERPLPPRALALIAVVEFHLLFAADLPGAEPLDRNEVLGHVNSAIEFATEAEPLCAAGGFPELILRSMLAFALAKRVRLLAGERDGAAGDNERDHAAARRYALLALEDQRIGLRRAFERLPAGLAWTLAAVSFSMDTDLSHARWQQAISLGLAARAGLVALFTAAVFRQDREEALRIGAGIYQKLAYAIAMEHAGHPDARIDVISLIENGRAVLLRDALSRVEVADALAARGEAALAEDVRRLLARVAELENLELGSHDPDAVTARRLVAGGRPLADAIAGVREESAVLSQRVEAALRSPAGESPGDDARRSFERTLSAAAASAEGPLCYLLHVSRGHDGAGPELPGMAAIVTAEPEEAVCVTLVSLPGLTADRVTGWLARWDPADESAAPGLAAREAMLADLGTSVMAPVFVAADRAERLILLPDGTLSMLPLHAASVVTADGTSRSLCTQATISYALSVMVLRSCQARVTELAGPAAGTPGTPGKLPARFLGVAGSGDELRHTLRELESAAAHFEEKRIIGNPATPDAVRDELAANVRAGSAYVVHFACHAKAEIRDPLSSHIQLGPGAGDQLTLAALLGVGLGGARLAVLSACETGVPGTGDPDQYVSLATGIVQIGAAGVIATMRPVSDRVARRLIRRFYQEWAVRPRDPVMALRVAQSVLSRDGTLVGDWAPFFFIGA